MKVLDSSTKFAHLGKPGTFFSKGFARRLKMIEGKIDLSNKKILDLGCGEGVWLKQFTRYTDVNNVFGSEYDYDLAEYVRKNIEGINSENIKTCPGENLVFEDNFFDVVFQNEVLEHVQDDQKTLNECLRVLKENGVLIFFTPNRGWPFEQHGMFLFGKYIWGNIPLLPWLPLFIRKKLSPHVKNYSNNDIKKLIRNCKVDGSKFEFVYHSRIFPGFDGMVRKFGKLGRIFQRMFFALEKTPLNFFGISHFVIVRKVYGGKI